MYLFLNLNGIETATGPMGLHLNNMTILILPLGTCIKIATGSMSFIILGTVMPLGVHSETANGRMDSYFFGLY